ncbi:MAG: hypothetical protein A2Y97_00965 [Nitrospirae bacterium RBG_13_39_12]|nr:MAG: hypothetical protein A2Y97_00965 [Nitrospirae bacterium RBG_13_39_12]
MSLNRFLSYSFALHTLFIIAVLLFIPVVKEKKPGGEFFTRLVSPDELFSQKRSTPAFSEGKSSPHTQQKPVTPAPSYKRSSEKGGTTPLSHLPSTGKEALQPETPSSPVSPSQGTEGEPINKRAFEGSDKLSPPIRERLFDKGVIGDIAKRDIEKKDSEKKDTKLTFDTKDYRFMIYNKKLKERIESIWFYPPDAAAKGIYGDLIIKFIIKKNGKLGTVELVRTSGHKNLDDAAIKALRDGEPYWPLPDEWGMEAYTIEGHFIYSIYGYYIR